MLKKVAAGLALNLHSASPENNPHQPAPGVFVPIILPCPRDPYLPRHEVACNGPADFAHLFASGINSTRTKPSDVRFSLRQLQLQWVDGSYVHMIHAQQHYIVAAVGMKRHWDPREEQPLAHFSNIHVESCTPH